jgi:hypothetical protein
LFCLFRQSPPRFVSIFIPSTSSLDMFCISRDSILHPHISFVSHCMTQLNQYCSYWGAKKQRGEPELWRVSLAARWQAHARSRGNFAPFLLAHLTTLTIFQ